MRPCSSPRSPLRVICGHLCCSHAGLPANTFDIRCLGGQAGLAAAHVTAVPSEGAVPALSMAAHLSGLLQRVHEVISPVDSQNAAGADRLCMFPLQPTLPVPGRRV